MLGTPPAFVLSQDQTLKFNFWLAQLLAQLRLLLFLDFFVFHLMEPTLYLISFSIFKNQPSHALGRVAVKKGVTQKSFQSQTLPLTFFKLTVTNV